MLVYSFKYVIHRGSTGSAPRTSGRPLPRRGETPETHLTEKPVYLVFDLSGLVLSNIRAITQEARDAVGPVEGANARMRFYNHGELRR